MDSKVYRQVFGNFPESQTVFHHLLPCHNLLSLDALRTVYKNLDEENEIVEVSNSFPFYKPFGYKSDINTVFCPGSGTIDRPSVFVQDKLIWKEKLTNLRPKNINQAIRYLHNVRSGKIQEPDSFVQKYLKLFKNDPEPEFEGDYNWLYTGGNLDGFAVSNIYHLVSAGEVDGCAVLNVIEFDSKLKNLGGMGHVKCQYYLSCQDPVFQTVCNYKDNNSLFVLRQRRQVTLIKLQDYELNEIWSYKINDFGILTSCDISVNASYVATVNNRFHINVFDTKTGKEVITFKHSAGPPSWSQIFFNVTSNALYLADHYSLNVLDLRVINCFKKSSYFKTRALCSDFTCMNNRGLGKSN